MRYSSSDIKGKVPSDFTHPKHINILQKNMIAAKSNKSNSIEKLELLFETKQHGYQWFEGYTKPLCNKRGTVVLILSCTRNIQERKNAEIETRKREIIQQNLLLSSILPEK